MEVNVPFVVYEGELARNERTVKRLIIALVATIIMLFLSNAMWLYAWNMYDYVEDEVRSVTVDGGDNGNTNYIGGNGDISNGEDYGSNLQEQTAD